MSQSPNISLLKFSLWRPIGVCDKGPPQQRRAKMFSKADLNRICSPGVTRHNWRKHPEVLKIVERYAEEVAEISTLTKGMKRPGIAGIRLVGAVMGHDQTPELNLESEDGRVQFFQVEFRDTAEGRRRNFRAIHGLTALFIGLALLGIWNWWDAEFFFGRRTPGTVIRTICNKRADAGRHAVEMRRLRREMIGKLKSLPDWSRLKTARAVCSEPAGRLEDQEILLLRCLVSTREETKGLDQRSAPKLDEMENCAGTLCAAGLAHLDVYCRQL